MKKQRRVCITDFLAFNAVFGEEMGMSRFFQDTTFRKVPERSVGK